ncbi:unnamed protein product, partial [marine sediment metagenome]
MQFSNQEQEHIVKKISKDIIKEIINNPIASRKKINNIKCQICKKHHYNKV